MTEVGIVGKPNVGKSTFYVAATLATAEIANYPFTTIKPNRGVGYTRSKCPHVDFKVTCNPNNSQCESGTRLIPIEMIDVAGLVPGAHTGKGLGNQFLDDLRQASALIHVVDLSGSTNAEGQAVKAGTHDPAQDVRFLEEEISQWIAGILSSKWDRLSRTAEMEEKKTLGIICDQLGGLGITENQVGVALRSVELPERLSKWTPEHMLSLAVKIRETSKPIIIAANKADIAPEGALEKLKNDCPGSIIVPTCAEYELALRRAQKAGLIDYIPGSSAFEIKNRSSLNDKQLKALSNISDGISRLGSTGIQECLEQAIYKLLDMIVIYPVEDESKLCNKQGQVLPDAHLLKRGSTALDLAFKVHTDIGKNFIRAIDVRTRRVIGSTHELANGDVIKIVAKS